MMRAWTTAAILGSALVVAGPAASAEKVVFQFGWLPGGDRAAYYLASHVGLFAAEGASADTMSPDAQQRAAQAIALADALPVVDSPARRLSQGADGSRE